MAQHCTHLEIIFCKSEAIYNSLDKGSSWCDNNHMVIAPIKTKSDRQKHHLIVTLTARSRSGPTWARFHQVSEHRLLGITIESKLRWESHTDNTCKTVSRRVFLLSKLRYIVDIDTSKLFFNADIRAHIDFCISCGGQMSRCSQKEITFFPDTTLTTDQTFREDEDNEPTQTTGTQGSVDV